MATTNTGDSAFSGGLLVILGIVVAVALAFFIFNYNTRSNTATIAVHTDGAGPSISVTRPSNN